MTINHTSQSRRRSVVAALLAAAVTLTACGGGEDGDNAADTADTTSQTYPTEQVGERADYPTESYLPLDTGVFSRWESRAGKAGESDAQWALKAGIAESFAWEPASDSSPYDAIERAKTIWNQRFLYENERKLTTMVPMNSRVWTGWGDDGKQFFPTVTILPDDHPADTETDVSRVVKIDQKAGKPDDDRAADTTEVSIIAHVRMHNFNTTQPPRWRIDNLTVTETLVE